MSDQANDWIDWPIFPRWVKWAFWAAIAGFFIYICVVASAWRLHGLPMRIEGIALRNIYQKWDRDGRPPSIEITNYVISSSSRFFVCLNRYLLQGTNYQCQFAVESRLFGQHGFLAITTNDTLIWIDNKRGPE